MSRHKTVAVVLAAGKGTRMCSSIPKVLHKAAGHSLLEWVLREARKAGCEQMYVIVGHQAEEVRSSIAASDVVWVEQSEQLGTGHALAQVEQHLKGWRGTLLVLSGDVPLVTARTLKQLAHEASGAWGAMAVAEVEEPGSLGRVVKHRNGKLDRIVEVSEATSDELKIPLINAGIYALPAPMIFDHLRQLEPAGPKGEYYLTHALAAASSEGQLALVDLSDPREALGVNDRRDLARAHQALHQRKAQQLMVEGVTLLEPERTTVEADVCVGSDTVIHGGVSLLGNTRIGRGCVLHQGAWIRDSELDDNTIIKPYTIVDGSRVGRECTVGPFARLRPASVLLQGARVGNFVELKKTRLGEHAKASHLTYLGDATIGDRANVGAGVVTCNYDGQKKHATEIGEDVFVGSDTMLVAPVSLGDGSATAAGSVITHDVPADALGVGRARQRNVAGWANRRHQKKNSADEEWPQK